MPNNTEERLIASYPTVASIPSDLKGLAKVGNELYIGDGSTVLPIATASGATGDAATGRVGEYLSTTVAIGSAISETTATPVDVATLALTAGIGKYLGQLIGYLLGLQLPSIRRLSHQQQILFLHKLAVLV